MKVQKRICLCFTIVRIRLKKAKDLYIHLAWKNDTDAMNRLGIIFGNEGNFKESKKWFLKAAALGDEHAKNNLKVLEENLKK